MSEAFRVDVESLRCFRIEVERIRDRVGDLHRMVDGARLPPGTFTRTEGGQVADVAHIALLDGIGARLDAAAEQLQATADATAATADTYETTDANHAAAMSDIETRLDATRGYQA